MALDVSHFNAFKKKKEETKQKERQSILFLFLPIPSAINYAASETKPEQQQKQ